MVRLHRSCEKFPSIALTLSIFLSPLRGQNSSTEPDPRLAPLRLRSGQAVGCTLSPLRGWIRVALSCLRHRGRIPASGNFGQKWGTLCRMHGSGVPTGRGSRYRSRPPVKLAGYCQASLAGLALCSDSSGVLCPFSSSAGLGDSQVSFSPVRSFFRPFGAQFFY